MSEIQDARAWFSSTTGNRVTAVEMAEILNISRNATNSRLAKGLDSDDLIAISRGLGVSPIHALVELGKVTYNEVFDFLDSDGTLLASASQEELIYRLAEESLPTSDRIRLGAAAKALADRRDSFRPQRSNNVRTFPTPDVHEEEEYVPHAAHTKRPEPEEGDDDFGPGA